MQDDPVPSRAPVHDPRSTQEVSSVRTNDPISAPPQLRYVVATAVVTGAWAASLGISVRIEPSTFAHDCALLVHLASLVAGMGAVLTVDWYAAQWLLGRRERSDVMRLVGSAHSLIWLGLVGLTASGAVLQPDVDSAVTQVKLVAVLVLALNGLHARALQHHLEATAPVPRRMVFRAAGVAAISQLGWWTALVIGCLNSH